MSGASAPCKSYTDGYRNCLKECRDSGRSKTASKTCKPLALKLDNCREEWRKKNPPAAVAVVSATTIEQFDGTRILPNEKCRPLSCKVQACIKWRQGDQSKCQEEITALKICMQSTQDQIVAPTEGDKVWSDYKKQ
mmetsp:Transcript_50931/g.56896  ORF Transcript_50931/g.56896 Transcript_50931/m.56896 type:complete len:136 (+) Transcript_50931:300-707(+)